MRAPPPTQAPLGFTDVNDMGGIVDWPYGTVAGSEPDGA